MRATVHVLRQIDVGDAIDLTRVTEVLAPIELTRGTTVLRGLDTSKVAGVVLRREPLDLHLGSMNVASFTTDVRVRLFDFGVVAVRFTAAAEVTEGELIDLAVELAVQSTSFDDKAMELWRGLAHRLREAVRPWSEPSVSALMEDYTVFVLPSSYESAQSEGTTDRTYAHVLLGEPQKRTLAASTVHDVARRTIRYYADDLVLVDYDAAIVVDREGGADLVDIFEVASAQLLELRFYDALLGRALEGLLTDMRRARTTSWFFRSPFTVLARRAAILALELGEMTDRLERAITLVGDTYSSHIYRETAVRFRLAEAGASVREKVSVIDRAAEVLSHEIQGRRDLVLEVLVILLILLEVVLAIRA
jgi:hypothetical protein